MSEGERVKPRFTAGPWTVEGVLDAVAEHADQTAVDDIRGLLEATEGAIDDLWAKIAHGAAVVPDKARQLVYRAVAYGAVLVKRAPFGRWVPIFNTPAGVAAAALWLGWQGCGKPGVRLTIGYIGGRAGISYSTMYYRRRELEKFLTPLEYAAALSGSPAFLGLQDVKYRGD